LKGDYTLIVPALDRTGPVNVAVDIGLAASKNGWKVRLLFLTAVPPRDDLHFADEVRQFRWSDILQLRGVVHTHCLRPDLLGLFFAWNRNIIRITTLHNFFLFDVGFDKRRIYVVAAWHLWRRALRRFDIVVCISEAMRRYYRRSLPGQPLELAYNFRAAPSGTPADPASLAWIANQKASGKIVLSFVGSLSERKNVLGLVSALARAPSLSLIVCGQGPLRDAVATTVQCLNLQDRVRLEGQILSPASITRHTDALILPSYAEGFPLAVLEAASVGIPVLLSNITVHRELAGLGFGRTFDHRQFSDLDYSAQALKTRSPAPSQALMTLWAREFAPHAGFARYEALIAATQLAQ
jgi:glycosyltransferase involved in cell wall biosynthesis